MKTRRYCQTLPATGSFAFRCPPGRKLKIEAAIMVFPAPTAGDECIVAFRRQANESLVVAKTAPLLATITEACFFVGAAAPDHALLDSTTVATGVANYNTTPTQAEGALPDIEWDTDVSVVCQISGNPPTNGRLMVKESDVE